MDFVDDFRSYKSLQAIAEPFILSDEKIDAVLASTAESLCDEMNLKAPGRLAFPRAANRFLFPDLKI